MQIRLKKGSEDVYVLVNEEKAQRALNGSVTDRGRMIGGVKDEEGKFKVKDIITEYDRLGGLIELEGDVVAMGSFFDFETRKPRKTPRIRIQYKINGKIIEVDEGSKTPGIVRAAKQLEDEERKAEAEAARDRANEIFEDEDDEVVEDDKESKKEAKAKEKAEKEEAKAEAEAKAEKEAELEAEAKAKEEEEKLAAENEVKADETKTEEAPKA